MAWRVEISAGARKALGKLDAQAARAPDSNRGKIGRHSDIRANHEFVDDQIAGRAGAGTRLGFTA